MKTKAIFHCFFVALLLNMGPTGLFGQKKVLGKPELFQHPVDYFSSAPSYEKFIRIGTTIKDKENAWAVFSDRDNNPVYQKPTTASKVTATLGFRDHCYVINEEDDWIEIVDASVDKLKIVNLKRSLGWVPKKKMLLWTSGLVQSGTNISQKVLLGNRADEIIQVLAAEKMGFTRPFKGPETNEKEAAHRSFDLFFVLKKENGRVLLSEDGELSTFNLDKIIGWVDERRCIPFYNRIWIEPNFSADGWNERKARPNRRLLGFMTEEAAKNYAELGILEEKEVVWAEDPVTLPSEKMPGSGSGDPNAQLIEAMLSEKMSNSNPYRLSGSVFRLPVLSSTESGPGKFNYFRSIVLKTVAIEKKDDGTAYFDSPQKGFSDFLNEIVGENGEAQNDLQNTPNEKVQLWAEAYFPQNIRDAQNPATSFVLFFPENELVDYRRAIGRLDYSQMANDAKGRAAMHAVYIELIEQFSGENGLRNSNPDDLTREEVFQLMNGFYGGGIHFDVPLGSFRIGDIIDPNKMSDFQFGALVKRAKEVSDNLDKALHDGENYDFSYTSESGNRFYWIAADEAF